MAKADASSPKLRTGNGDFLLQELERIRNLPENAPNDAGDHVELFWSLVVGLCKTTGVDIPTSIGLVNDFLLLHAPEVRLPLSVNFGPERLKLVQERVKAFVVDPLFALELSTVPGSTLWPARKAGGFLSIVMIAGMAFNHWQAVSGHQVSPSGVFLLPLFLPLFVGGTIEPRIIWAMGNSGHLVPRKYKLMGSCLVVSGAILVVALAFYYGIW